MKRISLLLTYSLKVNLVRSIIAVIILVLILVFTNYFLKTLNYDIYENIDIPNNVLYCETCSDLEPMKSVFNTELLESNEPIKANIKMSLYNIEFNVEPSKVLEENLTSYQSNSENAQTYVFPSYVSNYTISGMPNYTFEIPYLINGDYPVDDSDVLIGEYLAQGYLKQFNLYNYDELLGKSVTFKIEDKDYTYKISGIIAGSKDILTTTNQEYFTSNTYNVVDSYYKEFDSEKAKEEYIKDNKLAKDYYFDSSYNSVNIELIVRVIFIVIASIIYVLILLRSTIKNLKSLNYYKFRISNYLIIVANAMLYFVAITVYIIII